VGQFTNSSLATCKNWLESCASSHSICAHPKDERTLPTRLIDVGCTDMTSRVVSTKGLPNDIPYMTLSHCWGKLAIQRLTRDTLEAFQQEIPWAHLCKTFQDAILVTRILGCSYLWINSLCIIQDDEEDWNKESLLMSQVYGSSMLNLAASGAADGSVGLYFTRNPLTVQRCRIRGSLSAG